MPIRMLHKIAGGSFAPHTWVLLCSLVQSCISRSLCARGDLQHTVESHHRPEPAVESEDELIEIALQVLRTHPVVRSQEPRIEVPEDDMNHREMLVRLDLITLDRQALLNKYGFCLSRPVTE